VQPRLKGEEPGCWGSTREGHGGEMTIGMESVGWCVRGWPAKGMAEDASVRALALPAMLRRGGKEACNSLGEEGRGDGIRVNI